MKGQPWLKTIFPYENISVVKSPYCVHNIYHESNIHLHYLTDLNTVMQVHMLIDLLDVDKELRPTHTFLSTYSSLDFSSSCFASSLPSQTHTYTHSHTPGA